MVGPPLLCIEKTFNSLGQRGRRSIPTLSLEPQETEQCPSGILMNKAERIPVDSIILDNSNPRIKHYLEMYTVPK